jgi:hypothetical protein
MAIDLRQLVASSEWGSKRALGMALHARAGGPGTAAAASVATFVGRLVEGDDRWWRSDAATPFRVALAQMLDVDPVELFPFLMQGNEHHGFRVPAFPSLPPFDPAREQPVGVGHVGREADFLTTVLELAHQPTWVWVPPGGGKTFALAVAAAEQRRTATVEHLAEAAALLRTPGQLVLEVHAVETTNDHDVLGTCGQRGQVTVLAPFPRPDARLEAPGLRKPVDTWLDYDWRPHAPHRAELVTWAGKRVEGDSLLRGDEEAVAAWLDGVDPQARRIGTPEAILWVLAQVHANGLPKCKRLGLRKLAAKYLVDRAAGLDKEYPAAAVFTREQGLGVIEALARRRLRQLALPLEGRVGRADWEALLVSRPLELSEISQLIQDIGKSGKQRKADAERIAAEIVAGRPQASIRHLVHARLLVDEGDGRFALHPPWLAQAIVHDEVAAAIDGTSLEWGAWCFESARAAEVDAVLDVRVRDVPRLRELLAKLPAQPLTVSEIGAVEATFAAVGRALSVETVFPTDLDPGLAKLASAQLASCIRRFGPGSYPSPTSRRYPSRHWWNDWFEVCWAWSFYRQAPGTPLPDGSKWLFPGWTRPRIDEDALQHAIDFGRDMLALHLFEICEGQLDAQPLGHAADTLHSMWLAARAVHGKPITPSRDVWWERLAHWLARIDTDGSDGLPADWGDRMRAFLRAAFDPDSGTVFGDTHKPSLDDLLRRHVDAPLAIELLRRRAGRVVDELENVLARIPEHMHLDVVKAIPLEADAVARRLLRDQAGFVSTEAIGWLARQYPETYELATAWARRDPEAALLWVVDAEPKGIAEVLLCLSAPLQERWVDAMASRPRTERRALLAAFLLERRPDLATRLVPLLARVGPAA